MVEIERRSLSALEQNPLPDPQGLHDFQARIGRQPLQALPGSQRRLDALIEPIIKLLPRSRHPPPYASDALLDQGRHTIRIGEVDDSKTSTACFSLVCRTDPSSGRSDFLGGPVFGNLVQEPMVRHDEVGPLTHPDPSLDLDPTCLESVVLLEKVEYVEHHAVAQQAALLRMDDPGRNLVEDEFVVAYVDGVARVRTAPGTERSRAHLRRGRRRSFLCLRRPTGNRPRRCSGRRCSLQARSLFRFGWVARPYWTKKKPIRRGMGSGRCILWEKLGEGRSTVNDEG